MNSEYHKSCLTAKGTEYCIFVFYIKFYPNTIAKESFFFIFQFFKYRICIFVCGFFFQYTYTEDSNPTLYFFATGQVEAK